MLKGVIFDHDGLMFDTEKIWQKEWHIAAEKRNIVLSEKFPKDIGGTSGEKLLQVIRFYFHTDEPEFIRQEVTKKVYQEEAEHLDAKKGLLEILDMFQKNHIPMAVASSSPKEMIERNLKNAGVDYYFKVVVSGEEVERGKPYPDIFLRAADKLGIPAEECYVFEDAYNGIQAGHEAGCFTVMIPDRIAADEEMRKVADKVFDSLLLAKSWILSEES